MLTVRHFQVSSDGRATLPHLTVAINIYISLGTLVLEPVRPPHPSLYKSAMIPRLSTLAILSWVIILRFTWISAILINRTIDDTLGDLATGQVPLYTGDNSWNSNSANGSPCPECGYHPETSQLLDGTWHDGSSFVGKKMQINISFTGTCAATIFSYIVHRHGIDIGVAVYTYFVLFSNSGELTHVNFTLDDQPPVDYLHNNSFPNLGNATFQYNQTTFAKDGMTNTSHTLIISCDGLDTLGSVILFDYAVYTWVNQLKHNAHIYLRIFLTS